MKKALKIAAIVLAILLVLGGVGFSVFLNARTWWLQRNQQLVTFGAQQAVSTIIQTVKQRGELELSVMVGKPGEEQTLKAVLVEKAAQVATPSEPKK